MAPCRVNKKAASRKALTRQGTAAICKAREETRRQLAPNGVGGAKAEKSDNAGGGTEVNQQEVQNA